jgi:hypothetical protein
VSAWAQIAVSRPFLQAQRESVIVPPPTHVSPKNPAASQHAVQVSGVIAWAGAEQTVSRPSARGPPHVQWPLLMKLDAMKPADAQQLVHSAEAAPLGSPVIERQVAMSMFEGGLIAFQSSVPPPPPVPPLAVSLSFESSAQPPATSDMLAIDRAKEKSFIGPSYAPPRSH